MKERWEIAFGEIWNFDFLKFSRSFQSLQKKYLAMFSTSSEYDLESIALGRVYIKSIRFLFYFLDKLSRAANKSFRIQITYEYWENVKGNERNLQIAFSSALCQEMGIRKGDLIANPIENSWL